MLLFSWTVIHWYCSDGENLDIKLIIYPAALFGKKTFQIGNSERSINFIHNNIMVYRFLVI